jgi:non-ribosomal peptide synthetase-like protein
MASFRLLAATSWVMLVAAAPALYFMSAVLVTILVAALKWAIVGRYRPRIEPLWAPFVRHSELITGLYESVAVPVLGLFLTGTPWIAPLLRLFGAQVGRRAYVETTYLTEFDLVRIGDDASVGRASSLQTHLFEDRVMKMSTVRVGRDCSVGPRSVVLYDSVLGDGSSLDGLSLVMKGESLPDGTCWRGVPSRLVD